MFHDRVEAVPQPLTPTQQRVVDELLDPGGDRPTFAPDLAARLRVALDTQAIDCLDGRSDGPVPRDRPPLVVTKRALTLVHQCERHLMADEREAFAWSAATVHGTLAHTAIELASQLGTRPRPPPAELVDLAVQRLIDDERGPAPWLLSATMAEQAQAHASATDAVTKFEDSFPPIDPRWRPRVESRLKANLAGRRVELSGKVDLALGRANGRQARTLIIDLKTGRPSAAHTPDLRFYALLETLRVGVPPFRLASFYLDSGDWRHEDVTEDLLWSTTRRVGDAIGLLVQLLVDRRPARESPGPACHWCTDRPQCPSGLAEPAQLDQPQLDQPL